MRRRLYLPFKMQRRRLPEFEAANFGKVISRKADIRATFQDMPDGGDGFEACEIRSQAEMRAECEAQMLPHVRPVQSEQEFRPGPFAAGGARIGPGLGQPAAGAPANLRMILT